MPTLKHQDGDVEFDLESSGYWINDGKLYVSASFEATDPEAFPERYLFAVEGYVLDDGLRRSRIEISTNEDDEPPNVHVYAGFHAAEVEAVLDLDVQASGELTIKLSIFSEDVNYYDERAKRNEFVATLQLAESSPRGLWMPQ